MEETLAFITGNNSELAQDLIWVLSRLVCSFFSQREENADELYIHTPNQDTSGTSDQRSSGLCSPVNHCPGEDQPGEHSASVCPSGESSGSGVGSTQNPCHRRRPWNFWLRTSKTSGIPQLVASVSLGEVGAVFGLEISRLARSSADLMKLLELCGLFHTLVIDEDGVYDMGDFNDRLVVGLKGTMGEAELHILRSRMLGGKENAATKGELRFPLPVGYVYDPTRKTIPDPDEQVYNAISTVFRAFRTTGSAYGVVRHFASNSLLFPKRAYGGAWNGKLTWGTLTHSRVLSVLHNPAYAGAYVYGRYKDKKTVNSDGHFEHHTVCLPKEEWKVFLPDHHEAYISWEEFEANQKLLDSNRTNNEVSGPAREGAALLQGIILCGRCGRHMTVRYTGNGGIRPAYECLGRWEHGNKATCTSIPASIVDHAISDKILSILKPSQLEIALKVIHSIGETERSADRNWKLSLERAQYEADRAERQYMLAEPENRLVVRTLENAWNQKLQDLEQVKQDYTAYCSKKPWNPTGTESDDIFHLAEQIPAVWNAPSSTPKEKKRIIRILIEDVTVLASAWKSEFSIGIRFRSGCCEAIPLVKPGRRADVVRHDNSTIALIRELSASMDDSEIVAYLKSNGILTKTGTEFTKHSIRWIRHKNKIPNMYQCSHQGFTVDETANLLGISTGKVYYYIDKGIIPASKQRPGWPWEIALDASKISELRNMLQ